MANRNRRVREYANDAGLDVDEALVTLWDTGLDRFETGDEYVYARESSAVSRALGLASAKEQLQIAYWLQASELSREDFVTHVAEHGVTIKPGSRRIPKNSLRRLRKLFHVGPAPQELAPADPINPLPPLRWEVIGSPAKRQSLTYDQVLAIHAALEEDFARSNDPIIPPGVRSRQLLESAVARPETSFGAELKYPTAEMAAAALFHSIVHNHPFHNGNKRTALVSLLALLDENDRVLTASEAELFRFTLRTAQHRLVPAHATDIPDREVQEIARWIRSQSRRIERGELPMKWGRLRQRLRDFDCECMPVAGGGNKMSIVRTVSVRRRIGRDRKEELRTIVGYAGDGTELSKPDMHALRRDLRLDDAHDVDSATFYRDAYIDSFIIEYRRILQRLAKL